MPRNGARRELLFTILIGAPMALALVWVTNVRSSPPPTTEHGGQTVLVVREPEPCNDEDACPEMIRVGNGSYTLYGVSVAEDSLGPVHGVTAEGPISGIDQVRVITDVPADDALGAREPDGSWTVVVRSRPVGGEGRERFCAPVDEPTRFAECQWTDGQ